MELHIHYLSGTKKYLFNKHPEVFDLSHSSFKYPARSTPHNAELNC
jgi:hypothetical protein